MQRPCVIDYNGKLFISQDQASCNVTGFHDRLMHEEEFAQSTRDAATNETAGLGNGRRKMDA